MTDTQLEGLIGKLEKATEGSRVLDRKFCLVALPEVWSVPRSHPDGLVRRDKPNEVTWSVPAYTTDLNAALALVEEKAEEAFGEFVLMGVHRCRHKCPFDPWKGKYEWTGWLRLHAQDAVEAKSFAGPAVALLTALLRTLQDKDND